MSFRLFLLSLFILVNSICVKSQVLENNDSTKYKIFLPDYVKLQFAGGIGFLSTGVGYTFLNRKLDISLFYGYTPKYFTSDDLHSVSLQFIGKPLSFKLSDNIKLLPLNFGMFAHHTFGNEL